MLTVELGFGYSCQDMFYGLASLETREEFCLIDVVKTYTLGPESLVILEEIEL